ncbi:hypothetical protein EVAR_16464_1 [Eumeta japonica]|uniref:Uncharacterized protein n=1 Tax=Eumeta variegata TaxID=151549 RepID=A0A4C1ULN0_EUMVA|nr:hypothetical protein EVAR_16464_1 [Eumeta japonica]
MLVNCCGLKEDVVTRVEKVQWPLHTNFEEPASSGLNGTRNLSIEYYSKIDKCPIKIGVWHILPQEVYEKLKDQFSPNGNKEELHKLLDKELADSDYPVVLYCHVLDVTIMVTIASAKPHWATEPAWEA